MVKVSIVVPTYKEVGNIPLVVKRVDSAFKSSANSYSLLFVDDNSSDGSEEAVASLVDTYPVAMHVRKNERGLSSAVLKGFELSDGDIYVCMDADLSHPPEKIVDMCEKIENGADYVVASRNIAGGSADSFNLYRRFNAFISRMLARPLAKVSDPMSGFFAFPAKLYTSELVERLNPIGWKIALEVLVKMQPKNIAEIPIVFGERIYGESKLSLKEQLAYLMHLKRLYEHKYQGKFRFLLFGGVGAFGVVVDTSVLVLLTSCAGLPFKVTRIIAIAVAMTSNFLLNRLITFEDRVKGAILKEYLSFVLVCSVGALLNWFVSIYLVDHNSLHYVVASLLGVVVGTAINYIGSNLLVFRKKVKV